MVNQFVNYILKYGGSKMWNHLSGESLNKYYQMFLAPFMNEYSDKFSKVSEKGVQEYIDSDFLSNIQSILDTQKSKESSEAVNPVYIDRYLENKENKKLFVCIVVDYWALRPNTFGLNIGSREKTPIFISIIGMIFSVSQFNLSMGISRNSLPLLLLIISIYLFYSFLVIEQPKFYYNANIAKENDILTEKCSRYKKIVNQLGKSELEFVATDVENKLNME
ncbi:hypothetical protein [Dolosigranulum pigrum]|uniref:hypothetical protein n=1 Tax=Dolosigranulum pigrum TaxID=29394 RepID=UPI00191A0EF8|nr:hypothetical protein [Dolosigranulum pigrum]